MTAASLLHEPHLSSRDHAERVLAALHRDDVARHLLGDQPAPTARQVATTLRALADFPLCLRILPQGSRRDRNGDQASGLALYLEGFADQLAHHRASTPYDPRYWILGEPVTVRLLRLVSTATALDAAARPSAQQIAATLLTLADTHGLELPRRMVEVAGDGDLPWNGATGIGAFFRELADLVC
ncbi:hypothetical protein M3148_10195 [Georgenia satyanarayanai]|uniref:hypothetical protein n=1 Tax=Georgenia satyanarayanai TaxID=860221 RepID=UPI00203DB11F|nr:hypothetical protein [Georgenia satyanarayanai]MCM3661352.1 hypothetical protein [Georgenia satyanarayanai]